MTPFPWDRAMQFGFGVLRLSPDAFWRMTPRELAAAMIAVQGPVPVAIDRAGLDALMQQFPDHEGADERDG
ncbi:phage tail assembly chaperone [Tardiphaga alba]|uniref:Phage tail assembly chaperone n=1 Tax=Tardiphaga alba TaxID=340268 RepID=A0ABX8A6L8_9BRAD|nr:rcc01693 family protein [Tardiphaga alba]QUS39298.1 phage tail assembly chaperone [Tardiphaga alba]